MEKITDAPNAPKAIGPYSQAVVCDDLVFVSGQLPVDPVSGELIQGSIEEQTARVLENLKAILAALKLDFTAVAKTTIYLTDLQNFQAVNTVYAQYFTEWRPARATIQVAALPKGAPVEIELVASRKR
jgi:2-iminobutanoate/2-iminopropanoate deaminase